MNFYSQFKDKISYQLNTGKQVLTKLRFSKFRRPFVASELDLSTEMIPTMGEIYEDRTFVGEYPAGPEYSEIPFPDFDLGIGRTPDERFEPSYLDEMLVNEQLEISDAINEAAELRAQPEEIEPEPLSTIDDIFKPPF